MKQINLTLMAIILGLSTGFAQKTVTQISKSLTGIHVIVLNLSGNTSVQASATDEIKIKSYLQQKGDVWGWKSPNTRPAFQIMERISNDTIYITTPLIFSPNTIGISTYAENIENTIMIPGGKKIFVVHSDNLLVEDEMEHLNVKNTDDITVIIRKAEVKLLKCNARATLQINSIEHSKSYELNGLGSHIYNLTANKIKLKLK